MKNRRFLSFFFSLVILLTLTAPAYAAKDDVGDWEVAAKAPRRIAQGVINNTPPPRQSRISDGGVGV